MKNNYFYRCLFLILFGISTSALYGQTYTFTNCGQSGNIGPSQVQANLEYSGTPLDGQVTIIGQGIQEWIVPTTGDYSLSAAGASGGYTPNAIGGRGREITVHVTLTAGDVIRILVGQEGGRAHFVTGYSGGGGGGTYIINQTTGTPLLIAGGGGGAGEGNNTSYAAVLPGVDAQAYNVIDGTDGTGFSGSWDIPGAGGTNGNGGNAASGGSGGGGYLSDGNQATYGGVFGQGFSSGGLGGINQIFSGSMTLDIPGGFGGGAGAGTHTSYEANGGGGGGYSGGGGSNTRVGSGGGAGNFYTGSYISSSQNVGHGRAIITALCSDPMNLVVSPSTTVCPGTLVELTVTSTNGGTITWDNGITNGVPFAATVTTTYTATSSNPDDCPEIVTITVEDTIDPIAICQDISVNLDATGTATIVAADLDNGSSDNCGQPVSFNASLTSFSCADIGIVPVTLTVTDSAGNTDTCVANVTVIDNITPTVVTQDISINLDASGNATITAAQIDNGSSDICGIASLSVSPSSFSCSETGTNTVTLTVTDNSGNSNTGTATVTIADVTDPVITCPSDIIVNTDAGVCGAIVNYTLPTATDNCGSGGNLEILYVDNYTDNSVELPTELSSDGHNVTIVSDEDNNYFKWRSISL